MQGESHKIIAKGTVGGPVDTVQLEGTEHVCEIVTVHARNEISGDAAVRVRYPDGYTKTHTFKDRTDLMVTVGTMLATRYKMQSFQVDGQTLEPVRGAQLKLTAIVYR
jgi:hypothetical protein